MGGRGSSAKKSGGGPKRKMSALEAFKENSRQFNEAKMKALTSGATKLEFTDLTGRKTTWYREGTSWRDRPNSMEIGVRQRKGEKDKTFKAKFK